MLALPGQVFPALTEGVWRREMYESLTRRLAQVGDDVVLYPGNLYSEKPSVTMAETRARNVVFRPQSLDQWMMMFAS